MMQSSLQSLTRTGDYGSISKINTHASSKFSTKDPFRWWVFTSCVLMQFSIWYSFWFPSGLQSEFMKYYNLSNDQYNLLFSMSTGPTFIIPIFAGIIVDRIGISLIILASTTIIVIAQSLFLISCYHNDTGGALQLILMYISRCILGLGACSWQIGMNTILTKYFIDNELGFALSVTVMAVRCGFAAADFLSYSIYYISGENTVIWSLLCNVIIVILCWLFITKIVIWHCHKNGKRKIMKHDQRYSVKHTSPGSFVKTGYDLRKIPISQWIMTIIAGIGYVPFSSFTVIAADLLQTSYGYSQGLSDNVLLLPTLSTIIVSPLVGIFIDKHKKLTFILIVSSLLFTTFHIYVLYFIVHDSDNDNLMITCLMFIFLGFAFATFSPPVWSSIGLMVDSSLVGISNGLCFMSYAVYNCVSQIIVGNLTVKNNINEVSKYYYVEIFFILMSLVMLTCCLILHFYDSSRGKMIS